MAHRHAFSIPVADLEYGDREIDEEIPVAWLETAFAGSEATPRGEPGRLTVTVGKSGRQVMVRGKARAKVTVPCARTLDPVDVDLDADIFLLLAPAAPRPDAAPNRSAKSKATQNVAKRAQKKRGASADADAEAEALGDSDTAHDTYDGEEVVLDDFVREFLLLELPMFPLRPDLRSDDTTGMGEPLPAGPEAPPASREIDPRLAPLAQIASRLSEKNSKKE